MSSAKLHVVQVASCETSADGIEALNAFYEKRQHAPEHSRLVQLSDDAGLTPPMI